MKVITEPTVTVIAKQVFLGHPDYEIPIDGDDATKIGSFAAKGCYDSFGGDGRSNEANQRQVIEQEHGSVLEHVNFTLFIEGVTRGLTLEMNRHRPFAVSQRSTRYTAEEDAAIVLEPFYADLFISRRWRRVAPDTWVGGNMVDMMDSYMLAGKPGDELMFDFLKQAEMAFDSYIRQVKYLEKMNPLKLEGFHLRKWARGKARNILPHALETRVTYTGNLRAWRWFIEARSNPAAEPEIRRLADRVLTTLRKEAPLYFEDFEQTEIYDGIPVWTPKHSKV